MKTWILSLLGLSSAKTFRPCLLRSATHRGMTLAVMSSPWRAANSLNSEINRIIVLRGTSPASDRALLRRPRPLLHDEEILESPEEEVPLPGGVLPHRVRRAVIVADEGDDIDGLEVRT